MATLSVAEMWLRNALEHGVRRVSASVACGAALYYFVQPFLPDFVEHDHGKKGTEVRCRSAHRVPLQDTFCKPVTELGWLGTRSSTRTTSLGPTLRG